MRSTPHRIFVVLGAFTLGLSCLLLMQSRRTMAGSRALHEQLTAQQTTLVERIISIDSTLVKAFASDYSVWTEMCRFVDKPNEKWASENLDSGLRNYGADAIWVFDTSGNQVALRTAGNQPAFRSMAVPSGYLFKPGDPDVAHFFRRIEGGIAEFYRTGIFRNDRARNDHRCYGTLVVARLIRNETYSRLEASLGGTVLVTKPGTRHQDSDEMVLSGKVVTDIPICDLDGRECAVIQATVERHDIAHSIASTTTALRDTILLCTVILITLFWVLHRWLSRPLQTLTSALQRDDPTILDRLKTENTDFGSLAQALDLMFDQKREVERARVSAEQATQVKSEFLANMSHEIRTPLHGMLGMGRMLLEEDLTGRARSYADTLVQSAESLIQIVNDILDLSRIEAHKLELVTAEYDPIAIAEDVCRLFAPTAVQNRISILWDADPNVPWRVMGDAGRVRQVLSNLVGNAMKFTLEGSVLVRIRLRADNSLSFEVKDTGIGIPASRLEAVFDSFTQADGSTSRRFGGSGLGLTISRSLVELMGGGMSVESKEGAGSTFRFWIQPTAILAENRELPLRGKRVALLDLGDLEDAALANALKALGAQPTSELSGAEVAILPPERIPPTTNARIVRLLTFGRTTGVLDSYIELPFRRDDIVRAVLEAKEIPVTEDTMYADQLQVLVAEDNLVNQKLVRWHLQKMGFKVSVASNGRECLNLWQTGDYQLILMDIQMPEVSGIDACREIRRREGDGRHTLIVALTASALDKDRDVCLEAGMDAFVSKPFREQELRRVLSGLGLLTQTERPREVLL